MRRILMAASVLALCAAPALAADDVMAGFYGNTAISTGGMAEIHTHYRADHTFDFAASMMGMSRTGKGTWKIDAGGQICRNIEDPPAGVTNPSCSPIAAHKVGDTWTMTAKDGTTRTVTLKAGIQ
jgi:opacity protein-like surface antigen